MKLNDSALNEGAFVNWKGKLPAFSVESMKARTKQAPEWVHFGAGNIFRGFIAENHQRLLEAAEADTGIIAVETYDYEIIDKIYHPYDNLTLNITARSDGSLDQEIIASVAESLTGDFENAENKRRLEEVFSHPELKMVSLTVTEKGYALQGEDGAFLSFVEEDLANGPEKARHVMVILTALLLQRFNAGKYPIALVSMDNCSHNGALLKSALVKVAQQWEQRGITEPEFTHYVQDDSTVACPWSMIDRITPRPSESVVNTLEQEGWQDIKPIVTSKHTHIAPFVNVEETKYLFIEDNFPNGRIPLDKTEGIWFADRDTVNNVETMKVTTCLNPLHTAIAIVGSLFNYTLVSKAVADPEIDRLIYLIGYKEGLPVVTDPGIIQPKHFLDTVYRIRFPNPYIPDAPQRIATDTSMKVGIRFGETIKSYQAAGDNSAAALVGIPLAIAAWFRYLLGVDDKGEALEISPDPRKEAMQAVLNMSEPFAEPADIRGVLTNAEIFGTDLVEAGLSEKIQQYFNEMCAGKDAVRETLKKYL